MLLGNKSESTSFSDSAVVKGPITSFLQLPTLHLTVASAFIMLCCARFQAERRRK